MMNNQIINNRYKIVGKIGEGGSGIVFLAKDQLQNKTIALKKLYSGSAKNKKYEFLKNEFESLIKLRHPNLIEIYDLEFIKKSGELFLTMEFLDGKNLLNLAPDLKKSSLVNILVQICRALDYIHLKGIVHRDIKGENLLVVEQRGTHVAKLMDFGMARIVTTKDSGIGGTLPYTSPEILRGEKATSKSDLYALGILLYHISFGCYPFQDDTVSGIIDWHVNEKPRTDLKLRENIPDYFPEIISRLLQKDPANRFSNAAQIINFINERSGRSFPLETKDTLESYFKCSSLIGRDSEFNKLKEVLSFIKDKNIRETKPFPTLILIEGESGIGKSRLLKEFKHHCRLQEVDFFTGNVYEHASSAYGAFMEIIKNALPLTKSLKPHPEKSEIKMEKLTACMKTLMRKPGHPDRLKWQKDLDPRQQRIKFFDSVSEFFLTISELFPLVLCIEDLQWSDESTISLIEFLSRNARGKQILIIAAIRTEDLSGMPVQKLMIKAKKHSFALKIPLQRLEKKEVVKLVSSMVGQSYDVDPLAERIHKKTEGNPFFIEEIIKNIAEDTVAEKEVEWQKKILAYQKQIRLPNSLKAAIMKRVQRLDEKERLALKYLSVMNKPAPLSLIKRLLPYEKEALDKILIHLESRELLRSEKNGEKRYLLIHSQIRESLYQSLSDREQLMIHSEIGHAILELLDHDLYLEDLAYHFANARDRKNAMPFLQKAAEKSQKLYAHDKAIDFYRRALDLLPRNKQNVRIDLLFKLGETYLDFGAFADAIECFKKIIRSSKRSGCSNHKAIAKERIAWSYGIIGHFQNAKRYSEESYEMFKALNQPRGMANSLNNLGLSHARTGSFTQALTYFSEASRLKKKLNDRSGMINLANNIGLTYFNMGHFQESEAVLKRVLKESESQDHKSMMIASINNLGIVYKNMGMRAKAIQCYQKAMFLEEKFGDKLNLAGTSLNLGELLKLEGHYEQSIQLIKKASQLFEWLGNENRLAFSLNFLGDIMEQVGKIGEAERFHRRALEFSRECQDRIQEAYSCLSLSKDFIPLGKTEEAERFILDALNIADELHNNRIEFKSLLCLMSLNHVNGNYDESLKNYKAFAALVKKDPSSFEETYLGKMLYAEALMKKDQKEKARTVLQGVIKDIEANDLKEYQWHSYFLLAELSLREKKNRDAIRFLKKSINVINRIASSIDDESLRNDYLEHPRRKRVFEMHEEREVERKMEEIIGKKSIKTPPVKLLATLYEIVQMINSILDPNELLEKLMDLTLDVIGAERGLIILFDETSGSMSVKIARNMEKETIKDASRYSHSIVKQAKTGKSILTLDAINDKRFKKSKSVSLYEIHSLMCVPLRIQNRIIGTVYLDSRKNGPLFTEEDLAFVEALANHAAIAIEKAQLYANLKKENELLKSTAVERYQYSNIIGKSAGMKKVFEMIERVVDSTLPVLIIGESGTGKELVARAIHFNGPRKNNIFLSENCSAISETLLESELFGHMKGAFTGATNDRKGLFELATHGTLFLDEIGNMTMAMQSKLLRAIQEGEIRPIGGKKIIKVNPRIISASNMDLGKMLEEKMFREDLYYRLNVIQISLPPLRDRKEDIPLLVDHFLRKAAVEERTEKIEINDEIVRLLMKYRWPGNVRELENAVNRLSLLARNDVIDSETLSSDRELLHLIERKGETYQKTIGGEADGKIEIGSLREKEKEHIISALKQADGNRLRAAKILGVSRATIFRKIKQYQIQ
jgi:Nif-specific regulatory protein